MSDCEPGKCMDCLNCSDYPYNSEYDKRICFKSHERREKHFEKYGKSPNSNWMAPDTWVLVGSQPHGGCEFFISKTK